ncbi:MAG: hypothetical protein HY675_18960 [Chloroflexi bacterium]|nr:hypothetical protein [Chloroflexota bacterium]
MNRVVMGVVAVLISVAFLAGCAQGSALRPGERLVYMNAMEVKGSTTTDGLAAPDKNPEEMSKGFAYQKPGDFDKSNPKAWQVSSYMFEPSAVTVFQGDRVKISMFVINGNKHRDRVEDPDGKVIIPEQERNRGRQYELSFMADKPGVYRLVCEEHKPTMTALVTVVPRG